VAPKVERVPLSADKGRITAAGPSRIYTGFPFHPRFGGHLKNKITVPKPSRQVKVCVELGIEKAFCPTINRLCVSSIENELHPQQAAGYQLLFFYKKP
jgi:hypothetical protein